MTEGRVDDISKKNKKLKQSAHKTNTKKCAQNMRFYLSDFAGKEKGHESGFHYFGAHLQMSQNAFTFNTVRSVPPLVYPTLYASPLITITKHGYTKHYFEGMNRICSKLGGGFKSVEVGKIVPEIATSYEEQHYMQREGVYYTLNKCLSVDSDMPNPIDLHRVILAHLQVIPIYLIIKK